MKGLSVLNDKGVIVSENNKLATLEDVGVLVRKYATRLTNDERAQQFMAQVSLMAQSDIKFANCDKKSLLAAMMACVHLDLMPNTPEQHAYLIPYKSKYNEALVIQFQLGYKGIVKLALRSGLIKSLHAELVFRGDRFDVELGTDRKITHKPSFAIDRTDYSKVTHAYVTAVLTNGERVFEVVTRAELDKIQNSAKAKSTDSPWNTWANEMAKKTAIKRAAKLLPSSKEDKNLAVAAIYDSWAEAGILDVDSKGQLKEGEVDEKAAKKERTKRIRAAEKSRKQLESKKHKPKPVKAEEPKAEAKKEKNE